jgi:glycyl-tRNA synthetase alpha chain
LTYGLERIAAFLQDKDSIYDIVWARDPQSGREVKYRDVRYQDELQMSVYNFEKADVEKTWKHLEMYEAESQVLINQFNALLADKDTASAARERYPLLAAYELCLKCSHLFNLLDARGAISVTERVGVIARIRQLAVGLAKAYVAQQNVTGEAVKQQKGGAA